MLPSNSEVQISVISYLKFLGKSVISPVPCITLCLLGIFVLIWFVCLFALIPSTTVTDDRKTILDSCLEDYHLRHTRYKIKKKNKTKLRKKQQHEDK